MTTPDHRSRILKKLAEVWERNPEMRFCQLVENIASGRKDEIDRNCCIFHVRDREFERRMDKPYWENV